MAYANRFTMNGLDYIITPTSTAERYDSASSYSVGDYVYYDDTLYCCVDDATGAFDSDKWEAVTVGEILTDLKEDKADIITNYASGSVAHFTDGSVNDALSVVCHLNPTQSGSGDPSPQNIRPISGWTGCNINVSDADTSNPTVYPITWQTTVGEVYGGTIDAVTGKLIVDKTMMTFDGTEPWAVGASNAECVIADMKAGTGLDGICSILPTGSTAGCIRFGNSNTNKIRIIAAVSTYNITTQAEARTFTNGMEIVYPLATPIEYDIPATKIPLLFGVDNVWHDANGNTDVTYKANTKLYIDNLVSQSAEDDWTANDNIASGTIFAVGDNLLKSTAAIATGEQIVVGTNCTETSIVEQLNYILSNL